jgi:hypothetical protein
MCRTIGGAKICLTPEVDRLKVDSESSLMRDRSGVRAFALACEKAIWIYGDRKVPEKKVYGLIRAWGISVRILHFYLQGKNGPGDA